MTCVDLDILCILSPLLFTVILNKWIVRFPSLCSEQVSHAILRGTEYDITETGALMTQTVLYILKYGIFTPLSTGRSN